MKASGNFSGDINNSTVSKASGYNGNWQITKLVVLFT